jgi:hypothetical protein
LAIEIIDRLHHERVRTAERAELLQKIADVGADATRAADAAEAVLAELRKPRGSRGWLR